MSARRPQRIGQLVQETLSHALRETVSDPRLRDLIISRVDMSTDLKHAYIYYAETSDDLQVTKALKSAYPFLRRQLSGLKLRSVPELHFERDLDGEAADRVLSLLREWNEKDRPYEEAGALS